MIKMYKNILSQDTHLIQATNSMKDRDLYIIQNKYKGGNMDIYPTIYGTLT